MPLLFAILLFVGMALVLTVAGIKFWLRPTEAIERVTGAGVREVEEEIPAHPSLVFRDLLNRLGETLPASPKDLNAMQKRLMRAGMRGPNALRILYGSKILLALLLPLIMLLVMWQTGQSSNRMMVLVAAAGLGFFGPNEYVSVVLKRRQKEIARGLPNALDLLVVCVESGLGLDQAILQVAKELEHAHPDISEEMAMVNLELKAGKRRVEALRNLGERTNVEDLKKLVAVLIQADRFGTGIAQTLRGHAEYMRIQARQIAEEKAAKLGVKLIFPIFFCILPSLFVVTVGPVAIIIVRELLPMMKSF